MKFAFPQIAEGVLAAHLHCQVGQAVFALFQVFPSSVYCGLRGAKGVD